MLKRSELPDNVFGIPKERKYPMPDKRHTLSAIKLFGHVEDKYEKELADNIIKNMKKFNISNDIIGKDNRLRKYIKEDCDNFILDEKVFPLEEASKVTRKRLYHLSQSNLDKKTIQPRVPSNYFTKNGYEDGETARVCFSTSIDGCLRGLSENLTDKEFFVHIPDGEYDIFTPTKKEVPDCKITHEVWIKEPVKLKYIGKIKVIGDKGENGLPYTYGDNKKAELYDWEWNWIEKINEFSLLESVVLTIEKDHIQKGHIALSSLKRIQLTESIINKYKKEYPFLKHVKCKDTDYYICDGYIWFDKDNNLVCMVGSCEYLDDNTKWIVSLEVIEKYKGYGLSKQILDYATKSMNCKYLSVNKKNELAFSIYKKYGFKVYEESDSMYYMTIDKNTLKESSCMAGVSPVIASPLPTEPTYIVNYIQNNVFTGSRQERFGICQTGMKNLHTFGGKYNRNHYTHLEDFEKEAKNIKVYKYIGDHQNSIFEIIENAECDLDYFSMLTGYSLLNRSDIEKDDNFVQVEYIKDELSIIKECIEATAMADIINESYLKNEPDIYYNKDKFDSGEINLCFITGHSGSGKSTMGRDMEKKNIEHYQLDDLQVIADYFTMEDLKEYGDLIYSYFKGPGKKFYITFKELCEKHIPSSEYEDVLFKDFVHYAMRYAKSHKDRKFVLEGVWLFCHDDNRKPFFNPEEFKDYAFYIKGTSMIVSKHRGSLRDAKNFNDKKKDQVKDYLDRFIRHNWKWYFIDENRIKRFRKYFSNLMKKSTNESYSQYINSEVSLTYSIPMIGINENGRSYNFYRDIEGVYVKNELTGLRSKSYDDENDISESVINLIKKGFII